MPKIHLILFLISCSILSGGLNHKTLADQIKTEGNDSTRLADLTELIRVNIWSAPDSALYFANLRDSLTRNSQDSLEAGKSKNFVGMCLYVQGDYQGAIENYLQAIKRFEAIRDTFFTAITYNNLAACFKSRLELEQSTDYYKKALNLFSLIHALEWVNNIRINLATQYFEQEEFDLAIEYNQKALEYCKANNDSQTIGLIQGNLAGIYAESKEYRKALEASTKALEYLDPGRDPSNVLIAQSNKGLALLGLKQYQEATSYFLQGLTQSEKLGMPERKVHSLKHLIQVYKEQGNYQEAFKYQEDLISLEDTLLNKEKEEAIAFALAEFETEKKEQQIELITAQNQLQDEKIQKDKNARNFLILGILSLALISLLIYKAYTIKKNSLSDKELLLREIHHRVKNNMQVISSLLNIQKREISDAKAIQAIEDSKKRIAAMGLIHNSLYSNSSLSAIETEDYLQNLCQNIFETNNTNSNQISFKLNSDKCELNMDTLVPLGLLVNELISNSLKHAFDQGQEGEIEINLNEENGDYLLTVKDNGRGFNNIEELQKAESFGFKMIQAFIKKLNGKLNAFSNNGSVFEIEFKAI